MKLELIENAKFKAWERARLREESDYWVDQTETEVVVGIEIEDTTDSSKTQGLEMDTQEKIQNAEKKSNMDIKYARVLENVNPQNEDELPLRKVTKEILSSWTKFALGRETCFGNFVFGKFKPLNLNRFDDKILVSFIHWESYVIRKVQKLNFNVQGDMLIVLEKHSKEGWWKGQLGSKVGYFPEKAVEFVSEEEVRHNQWKTYDEKHKEKEN